MMLGLIAHAIGSCPRCGTPVPLRHAVGPAHVSDIYACGSCGPTTYLSRALAG